MPERPRTLPPGPFFGWNRSIGGKHGPWCRLSDDRRSPRGTGRPETGRRMSAPPTPSSDGSASSPSPSVRLATKRPSRLPGTARAIPVTRSCKSRGNLHDYGRQASVLGATRRLTRDSAPSNPGGGRGGDALLPFAPLGEVGATVGPSTSSPFPVRCSADIHQHARRHTAQPVRLPDTGLQPRP